MTTQYTPGDILKLPNGERDLIIDIKEDEKDKKYYECIGLTKDDDFDFENISFFEIKSENDTELIKRVHPTSEKFANLSKAAIIEEMMKISPEIRKQVDKILNEE